MNIQKQIANSFDYITIQKIVKGYIWSFLDAGVLAGSAYLAGLTNYNPVALYVLSVLSTGTVNAYNEYRKGEKTYTVDNDRV
ncbi:MAG: hypothetical protein WCQ96_02890 [Patescibacteria group bacterium]